MGEYLSVKRRVYDKVNGTCRYCGTRRRVLFTYNGHGPFCNAQCAEGYWGEWPESAFGRLPVEVQSREVG